MLIHQLDFAKMYQQHMQQAQRSRKEPEHWDKKASQMAKNCANPNDPYLIRFRQLMDLTGAKTLLDVGCGPGSISLYLANQFQSVTGIDYSAGMLEMANIRAKEMNVTNAQFKTLAWEDSWDDLPKADISVASRSTLVDDLKAAMLKLNRQTNLRVYTTHTVNPTFIDEKIIREIGREVVSLPTYIYAVNILHQMGIHASVDLIKSPNRGGFDNVDAFIDSVNWSLKDLTEEEIEKLRVYYQKQTADGKALPFPSRDWAMVSWDVVNESELTL
ncbi:methyltransferase domain-containing protein [Providencia alcalifaciens]|uniref:class I SAM-dependent methyltransferase n=1 Tax=Providencia alcalifaciens TaxID=126385 RepID=UPI001CE18634|nr:class I SAM-dependent methyltransferase [Providencia alcalifaciens]UBX50768.1 methyltransferase domain-containing protein [Providencia alcalifaciens]